MKTSLKRLLAGMVSVAMMMSMSVMAFADDDTADADDTTIAATEDAGDEDDTTDAATDDTADTTTAAATSNPSTGAADSMVALTAMGAFLVLAGGAAAVSSKKTAK